MTWYIHAFNEEKLYVVLSGKWFEIALHKDESWNEMIELCQQKISKNIKKYCMSKHKACEEYPF